MTFLRRLFRDRIAALKADHTWRERDEQRLKIDLPTGFITGVIRADGGLTDEECARIKAALHERAEQLFPDGGDKFDARRR